MKHKPKELMRVFDEEYLELLRSEGVKSVKVLIADQPPEFSVRVGHPKDYLTKRRVKQAVNKLKNKKRHEINKIISRLETTLNPNKRVPLQKEITRLENEFFLMFAWRFNYEWE